MEEIKNKVAESGILTIDLMDYRPTELALIDLKDQLWQEMVLKEKDFRDWIKSTDWSEYSDKTVCVYCSTDAIIPDWAYMLVVSNLLPFTEEAYCGNPEEVELDIWKSNISKISLEELTDARIVVKGCGDEKIPSSVFTEFIRLYQSAARSIMYGEPCSTVPVYKRKATKSA